MALYVMKGLLCNLKGSPPLPEGEGGGEGECLSPARPCSSLLPCGKAEYRVVGCVRRHGPSTARPTTSASELPRRSVRRCGSTPRPARPAVGQPSPCEGGQSQ